MFILLQMVAADGSGGLTNRSKAIICRFCSSSTGFASFRQCIFTRAISPPEMF
ncbi:unnamed protein product, partial [Nesidiocoris tenuis]